MISISKLIQRMINPTTQKPERPALEEPDDLDEPDDSNESERPGPDEPETSSRINRSSSFSMDASDSFVSPAAYVKPTIKSQEEEDIDQQIRDIEDDINGRNVPQRDDATQESDVDDDIRKIEEDIKDKPESATDDDSDDSDNESVSELDNTVDTSVSFGNSSNSAQMPHSAFYNDP